MSGNQPNAIEQMKFNTVAEAIDDIRAGKLVIVVDDEDRENEGDFICAGETVTPEIINFMATHGRGLICTPIAEDLAERLSLHMMVPENTSHHETAFTVSIDLIGRGCTTGISAYDRATGIRALVDPEIKASDYARPGHIFPLRAKTGGVLRRTGHTEAAIDLALLAGFKPVGVLVEILNEDGSMARLPQLMQIAQKHDVKIISIEDLVAFRMEHESFITRETDVELSTLYGDFEVIAYNQVNSGDVHLAIKKGNWSENEPVLVRVHSSTEAGDLLGTLFENYNDLLRKSIEKIAEHGKGVVLYMRHSEKDNDIVQKLNNLKISQFSTDHKRAFDQKDIGIGSQILRDLNITKMRLLTNQPKPRTGLTGYGLEIVEYVEI